MMTEDIALWVLLATVTVYVFSHVNDVWSDKS